MRKYVWLIDTIYRAGRISFREVNERWCRDVDMSRGEKLSVRTFKRWLNSIEDLFVINNQHLTEMYGDLNPSNAFMKAEETLTSAVRSLCDLITAKNNICMDVNDINYTLRKSGVLLIWS